MPIERDGTVRGHADMLPEVALDAVRATVHLYERVGFVEPWIGYLARAGDAVVGTCGFASPPAGGRVEIAYFTFPPFEGRGIATAMAAALVAVAERHRPPLVIAARTLPERGASHAILTKLGFRHVETLEHPEDGTVWEWQLQRRTPA
jgi:ribosomal-protein-alanine N-acetyltransferase